MSAANEATDICWRLHLASPPDQVYAAIATAEGRARFWAESAVERDGAIEFRFPNGLTHVGRILASEPSRRFSVEYFGGTKATFEIAGDGRGGTDLTLTEIGVPSEWRKEHLAGWVSVLLALKAAVDHGIDLRVHDTSRTWDQGFVDN